VKFTFKHEAGQAASAQVFGTIRAGIEPSLPALVAVTRTSIPLSSEVRNSSGYARQTFA